MQKQLPSVITPLKNYRVKFNINIADPTATIDATVFPDVAEQIYGITTNDIAIDAPDVSTQLLSKQNKK